MFFLIFWSFIGFARATDDCPLAIPGHPPSFSVRRGQRPPRKVVIEPSAQHSYRPQVGECVLGIIPPHWRGVEAAFVVSNKVSSPLELTVNGAVIRVKNPDGTDFAVNTTGVFAAMSVLPPAREGGEVICYGFAPNADRPRWPWSVREMRLVEMQVCASDDVADTICKIYREGGVVKTRNPYNDVRARNDMGAMMMSIK